MIYRTPFLQDFDNFIITFGIFKDILYLNDNINVPCRYLVIGDKCNTCNHNGLAFLFDSKTKKLIGKNGKINNINDWE